LAINPKWKEIMGGKHAFQKNKYMLPVGDQSKMAGNNACEARFFEEYIIVAGWRSIQNGRK